MGTKGTWHRGSGDLYRQNYPFGKKDAALATVDPRDAEIARLRAELADAHGRIAELVRMGAMQARTLSGKNRIWSDEERERYRLARAARLDQRARDDAEGDRER